MMFLSSFQDSNSFSFGLGGNMSARKAAIEAELRHMANFSGDDIVVEAEGNCVILTGSVDSSIDFYRALNVATDIAGSDKVIFRVRQD